MTLDDFKMKISQSYLNFYLHEDAARMRGDIEEANECLIRLEVLAEVLDLLTRVEGYQSPEEQKK